MKVRTYTNSIQLSSKTIIKIIAVSIAAFITALMVFNGLSVVSYAKTSAKAGADAVLQDLQTYAVSKEYQKAAEYLHDMYNDGSIFQLGVSSASPVIKDNGDGTGCGLYQGLDTFPDGRATIYFYYGGMAGGIRSGNGTVINWSWDSEGSAAGYYTFEGSFASDLPNGSGTSTEVVYGLYTNIIAGNYTNGLEDGAMIESQIKEVMEEFEYRDLTYTSIGGVRQDKAREVAEHIYEQITAYGVQESCTVDSIETELRNWAALQGGYIYMYDPNYTNVCNHGFGLDEDDGPFCNYEWCVWTTDGSVNGVKHIAG